MDELYEWKCISNVHYAFRFIVTRGINQFQCGIQKQTDKELLPAGDGRTGDWLPRVPVAYTKNSPVYTVESIPTSAK
jgi:hypothetical protein